MRAKRPTEGVMDKEVEGENFYRSGPFYLTNVNWKCANHQRCVIASLVEAVYILERDRKLKRTGPQALAPDWWKFFHFEPIHEFINGDSSIFGVIYEFNCNDSTQDAPRYVIAFRGTLLKPLNLRDLMSDLRIILNRLHRSSRFEKVMQQVLNKIAAARDSNIWLAGHSLGSSMALLVGRKMFMMEKIIRKTFLFNPPIVSLPIDGIKNEKVKHFVCSTGKHIRAKLAKAVKDPQERTQSEDQFVGLSPWVPFLFVNPKDPICCGYIGYFESRKGKNWKLATQTSIRDLICTKMGWDSEPSHHLPSAYLTVNRSPTPRVHGIEQWWRSDLKLQSTPYLYQ